MKKFYSSIAPTLIFCFITLFLWPSQIFAQQEEEQEYWTLVPGYHGDHIVMLDSTVVFLTADYGLFNDSMMEPNTLHLYNFNFEGEIVKTSSFNITQTHWLMRSEVLRSDSRHKVHRLKNGNFLIGGHAIVSSNKKENVEEQVQGMSWEQSPFLVQKYGNNNK
ncbi:MAG: hypothetical protein ACOC31_02495, partial [Bacteroidota bacterium]